MFPDQGVPGVPRLRVCDACSAGQITINVIDVLRAGSHASVVSISGQIGKLRLRSSKMLVVIEEIFFKRREPSDPREGGIPLECFVQVPPACLEKTVFL